MNVLIIDDLGGASPLVGPLLGAGHSVQIERSHGDACKEALAEFRPELVIVELGRPGYHGDTAWRVRRALQEVWPPAPLVLAVSGLGAAESRFRSELVGARLTLHEPFAPREVIQICEHLLQAPRAAA